MPEEREDTAKCKDQPQTLRGPQLKPRDRGLKRVRYVDAAAAAPDYDAPIETAPTLA